MRSSTGVRVGVVNCAAGDAVGPVGRAVWAALETQSGTHAKNFVAKTLRPEAWLQLQQGGEAALNNLLIHGMEKQLLLDALHAERATLALEAQALYCRSVLGVQASGRAVVCNGRVVGPLSTNETFNQEDFQLLEKVTRATSADNILAMVQRSGETGARASDLVMKVDALLSAAPKGDARAEVKFADDRHSVVKLRPREKEVYFDVMAVVDPVTRDAQRLAPLLAVLSEVVNVHLRVFMNCKPKLSEMPLKSFYRYVVEADVVFAADGRATAGPAARFVDLPQAPLLTLNMITPEGWLVESVRAAYDLDNIYMEEVEGVITADFELEFLILEGHCYDVTTAQPPRGLQFTLGTRTQPVAVDTIVMANLGYFQLKANPGAWILRLRKGRSEDIFSIFTHEGTDSPPDAEDVVVVMSSFQSKSLKVR
ncbi:UDP-glucose:glycoprotein glucosyltransferase 1-like, partial [Lampetra fluviatilis]